MTTILRSATAAVELALKHWVGTLVKFVAAGIMQHVHSSLRVLSETDTSRHLGHRSICAWDYTNSLLIMFYIALLYCCLLLLRENSSSWQTWQSGGLLWYLGCTSVLCVFRFASFSLVLYEGTGKKVVLDIFGTQILLVVSSFSCTCWWESTQNFTLPVSNEGKGKVAIDSHRKSYYSYLLRITDIIICFYPAYAEIFLFALIGHSVSNRFLWRLHWEVPDLPVGHERQRRNHLSTLPRTADSFHLLVSSVLLIVFIFRSLAL